MSAFKKIYDLYFIYLIFRFFDPVKNYFHFLNCFYLQLGTQDALWVWGLGQEIKDHWSGRSGWWKKGSGWRQPNPNNNKCFFWVILSQDVSSIQWCSFDSWCKHVFVFSPQTSKGRVFNKGACFHIQSKLHSVNMALSTKERNLRFQEHIQLLYSCTTHIFMYNL